MKPVNGHKVFFIIFLLFFITKVFSLYVPHDIWWDSSVFVGMGKYIYSSGQTGLWEPSRPLIWPLIVGFFWKIGLNAIFWGKLVTILFSMGILMLTYILANEIFDKKIAILSVIFLSLSQTFFLFNNILHSEIPSTFFALVGAYFYVKKKYSSSGLFMGLAFMARFFQLLVFFPLALLLAYLVAKKKESVKSLYVFLISFIIPVIPYLALNYSLYKNPFFPFLLQYFMTKYSGFVFHQPFYFYFTNIVKENILVLFSVLGIIFAFKKWEFKRVSIALILLFSFIPYNFVAHKETRLLIPVLPFLYIFTSYGVFYFVGSIKKYKKPALYFLLIVFFILSIPKLEFDRYDDNLEPFYGYIKTAEIDTGLWISNPAFIVYSDLKAEELIYFPLYDSEKIYKLTAKIGNAKHILINTCDILPCPAYDFSCSLKTSEFFRLLDDKFTLKSFSTDGQCKYYIYHSKN